MCSIRKDNFILKTFSGLLIDLPAPVNISNLWNFGSLLGMTLGFQIVSGLLLASHYNPSTLNAFDSLDHIMRDLNYGWFIRIMHLNGASFFFIFLLFHIGRGLYYGSFKMVETWNIGVVIFFLSMLTAFVGYVLPWGQMSFWGATVITNLLSAIPFIGSKLVLWVWGGFSVSSPTLSRFFMIHFLTPFLILALVSLHIIFLHKTGSSNPILTKGKCNLILFHWHYTSKDLVYLLFWLIFFLMLVWLFPFFLGDPENFILANSLVTPEHIVPEWYFLFAYAILRGIPNKLLGVMALVLSILILFFPTIGSWKNSSPFNLFRQLVFFSFLGSFSLLTWIGGQVVEAPFIVIGQIIMLMYFFSFFIFVLI